MGDCKRCSGECEIQKGLVEKPKRKWLARALLCVSGQMGSAENGEQARVAGGSPCASEILGLISREGGRFRLGMLQHKRRRRLLKVTVPDIEALQTIMKEQIYLGTAESIGRLNERERLDLDHCATPDLGALQARMEKPLGRKVERALASMEHWPVRRRISCHVEKRKGALNVSWMEERPNDKLVIFHSLRKIGKLGYLPIYSHMDIYRGRVPQLHEYFAGQAVGSWLKNAGMVLAGAFGLAAWQLDKHGLLHLGIAQFLQANGIEKLYTYFSSAVAVASVVWAVGRGSARKAREMLCEAQGALARIVESAHEKLKEEKRAKKANAAEPGEAQAAAGIA